MKDFKVKCISSDGSGAFTKGKIYEFKDGKSKLDDGWETGPFDDVNALNLCYTSQFELVGENNVFTKDDIRSGDKIWTENGDGIVIDLNGELLIRYEDGGWDKVSVMGERGRTHKVIRPTVGSEICRGDEKGETVFDLARGIGCEPLVKEISVEEATKLLTEKFGQNVRIRVGE